MVGAGRGGAVVRRSHFAPCHLMWTSATQTALAISLALALLVWLARAATPLAALTGGVITAVLSLAPLSSSGEVASPFHSALPPLLALFLLTFSPPNSVAGRKSSWAWLRISEAGTPPRWRRTWVSPGWPRRALWSSLARLVVCGVVVTAALAEATADTLASELGEVLGGPPFMVTSSAASPPGTDGAVSLAGTAGGNQRSSRAGAGSGVTLRLSPGKAVCAGLGAIAGLFVDSLLGATAERRGWLNNDGVNFLSTLAASVIATGALALQ